MTTTTTTATMISANSGRCINTPHLVGASRFDWNPHGFTGVVPDIESHEAALENYYRSFSPWPHNEDGVITFPTTPHDFIEMDQDAFLDCLMELFGLPNK
jgi:hypothetical protein